MNETTALATDLIESHLVLNRAIQRVVQQVAILEKNLENSQIELIDRIESLESNSIKSETSGAASTVTPEQMETFMREVKLKQDLWDKGVAAETGKVLML